MQRKYIAWQVPLRLIRAAHATRPLVKNVMFAQEAVELMNSISPMPPAGSRLNIKSNDVDPVIVIPSDGGLMRYGVGVFLLCWLGVWFFGFRSALTQLLSGTAPGSAQSFLFFWLAVWTLGGAFTVVYLYRCFAGRFQRR